MQIMLRHITSHTKERKQWQVYKRAQNPPHNSSNNIHGKMISSKIGAILKKVKQLKTKHETCNIL